MNDAEKSFIKDDYVWLKIGNSNISQKCIINWRKRILIDLFFIIYLFILLG
tara:strand:+ start:1528 stop:1680 length:153 start_codon:yes stop_codon:yes gene_type:complete